jgi:hypothetical protein
MPLDDQRHPLKKPVELLARSLASHRRVEDPSQKRKTPQFSTAELLPQRELLEPDDFARFNHTLQLFPAYWSQYQSVSRY